MYKLYVSVHLVSKGADDSPLSVVDHKLLILRWCFLILPHGEIAHQ